MKKFNKVLVVLSLVFVMLFAFVACNPEKNDTTTPDNGAVTTPDNNETEETLTLGAKGTVSIVVKQIDNTYNEYLIKTSEAANYKDAHELLVALSEKDDFVYETELGDFGQLIMKLGTLVTDNANRKFVCIYTSNEADKDVTEYCQEVDYKGNKVYTAGLGISSLHIVDGIVIYFEQGAY